VAVIPFSQFVQDLSDLGRVSREDPEMQQHIERIVHALGRVGPITRQSLAQFVHAEPTAVQVLATCAGLGQEQLINQMKRLMGTAGWITLARTEPDRLIQVLDDEFGIVAKVAEQLRRDWTFADVLLERHLWSRKRAASAIGQGRRVEDEVERVVKELGLRYTMRTQFVGRDRRSAPCDVAILDGQGQAQIVLGAKGFNSTGSKLSDAVREIEQMADVRRANQFVYALIDGIGWANRGADLRRIYDLWDSGSIDGMYTLNHLEAFEADLAAAARQKGLLG
jgi:hypothetical protein